jgi:carbon-monoxide dehydrogenase large subunit
MQSPGPYTEFGQKGIGESGAIGSAAAVASAVNDALRPLGVQISTLPITPRVIVEAIAAARTRTAA